MDKFSAGDIVRATYAMWENATEEEKLQRWEVIEPHEIYNDQGIPVYKARRLMDNQFGLLHEDELVLVDD